MTDHVYEDTIRNYEFAKRRAEAIIDAKWDVLTSRSIRAGRVPRGRLQHAGMAAFGHCRDQLPASVRRASAESDRPAPTADRTDPDSRVDPLRRRRSQDGSRSPSSPATCRRWDIDLSRFAGAGASRRRILDPSRRRRRRFVRELNITVSLSTARRERSPACTSRTGDWEVLSGPGNVVARQQDRGDLWELYKGLDGGSRVAMTTQQKVPGRGQAVFSDEGKREPGT